MGAFFSSQHLTDVTDALTTVQENIVSQKTLGDAAWLQVKNIHDRLDEMKTMLYHKACSKCKPKIQKILGETPARKRNMVNDLPPENQVLLQDIARIMIEKEMSKSGNNDVTDGDINLTLGYVDENRYAKMEEAHKANIEEYETRLRDAKENIKVLEFKNDEASVQELAMNNRLERKQEEVDKLQTKIEELERNLQNRIFEGSKLAAQNTRLTDNTDVLQTKFDALMKGLDNREREVKEVLQLRQENEKMSTIIAKLQKNQGVQIKGIQPEREEANTDIRSLEEEEHFIEQENAKHVKQIFSSAEEERVNKKPFEKSETQTKQSMTSSAHLEIDAGSQDSMENRITALQDESARYSEEISNSAEEINELKRKLTSLENENETLNVKITEMSKNKDELELTKEKQRQQMEESTEEINRMKKEMTAATKQKRTLNKRLTSLWQTHNELERTKKQLAKKKQEMEESYKEQMGKVQEENSSYANAIENAIKDINNLKGEMMALLKQIETLNDRLAKVSQTNKEQELTTKQLEKEKQEMEDSFKEQVRNLQANYANVIENAKAEINNLKDEMTTSAKQIETLNENIAGLSQTNNKLDMTSQRLEKEKQEMEDTLNEQLRQLQDGNTAYVKKISDLDEEITNLKRSLTSMSGSKTELENIVSATEKEKEKLTKQVTNLQEIKDNITCNVAMLKEDNSKLRRDLSTKTEELDAAVRELTEIKSRRKSVVMGVRNERSGIGKAMMDMVTMELTKRLQCILGREGIDVTIKLCQTPGEVPNGPLVVLCLNMSRVGTNIISALEGIKINQDVFVLVLHNTIKDNLSSLTPTSLRITGSELRQLGGIMDMVFSSEDGVYECGLNSGAVDKMATTLRKYAR